MNMTKEQQIEWAENSINEIEEFIDKLIDAKLDASEKEFVVLMPGIGLPLNYEIKRNRIVKADQTGVFHATKTKNPAIAFSVARQVKDGNGDCGQVFTCKDAFQDTIERQEKSLEMWQKMVDELKKES